MVRYFEELELGEKFLTPKRTVTETDVVNFAGLSGDYYSIHTDDVYAKSTGFSGRVAHGLLTLSIVSGLWLRLGLFEDRNDHAIVAFYGIDRLRFTAPVRPGDTVSAKMTITAKKDRGTDGLVSILNEVVNQDEKLAVTFTASYVWKKAPRGGTAPGRV